MSQNKLVIKQIIKSILLTEAPIDIWKNKNLNLSQEQISQAETYFNDLTTKYKALIHPTASDLTKLSFQQLETLYKAIEISKNKNLKAPFIQWITKQLKQQNLNLQQITEDYIPPVLSLQKNKDKFEPNFLQNLESIEQLNQALNQKVSSDELAVSEEQFGKLAEENGWVLYMPHTTEASCEIGKTGGRRDTTWCTTRPDASNMFLHYNAQPGRNIILFYVIKKGVNAEADPLAKMSVGFVDSKPMFNQGSGGISVDAANQNLTREKFEKVVGKNLANKFLGIMQQKAKELKGEHPAKQEFKRLIQNPAAFKAKLDSFAKDENGQELRANFIQTAFKYGITSAEVLTLLAKDADKYTRRSVAENPNTPAEVLTLLANDEESDVRMGVAMNRNTPKEILTLLAKDVEGYVRRTVAMNPNTPKEILTFLAKDARMYYVRQSVAENPNTPKEGLTLLAKDTDEEVRKFVAENPNTPIEALTLLAKDKDKDVRYRVAKNENTPPKVFTLLAKDTDEEVRKFVAENPNTPIEVLTLLAKDINKDVRKFVAKNPNTPIEVLIILAKDEVGYVRKGVAANPNTPKEILTLLAKDVEGYVRRTVAMNPNTPKEILIILAKEPNLYVRQYVAKNPNTPVEVLTLLAKDTDGYVRKFVAKNPNTPVEVLTLLAKDKDNEVRQVATERLNQQITENVVFEKVFKKLLSLI